MARHLLIAGSECWPKYIKDSLQIEAVLTSQIDTASFKIRGNQPTEGQEVIIYHTELEKITRVRMQGKSETSFDFGYIYYHNGTEWLLLANRSGSAGYDKWIDVSGLNIERLQTRLTTDFSVLTAPTYVDITQLDIGGKIKNTDGYFYLSVADHNKDIWGGAYYAGTIFAGIIDRVHLAYYTLDKKVKVWQVDCQDYTYQIDQRLVVETYENKTADWIVKDIISKYCSGFTSNNVTSGAPIVEKIVFDYKRPSECFKELAGYIGWEWYVDYRKDVWFFSGYSTVAPMDLTSGAHFRNIRHTVDTQGLRNRIYVRGGTYLSDFQTFEFKADGVQRLWNLGHKPHDISMTVGGVTKIVGIENIHDEAGYNYMMNFQEKYVRCSSATSTPASGTTMTFVYKFDIDVITMVEDFASQAAVAAVQGGDGAYEHVIVDDKLVTLEAAEAAGNADLREHANPRIKGSFETEINGWNPGQLVTLNLLDRGIAGTFLVQKVDITPATNTLWTYKIEYGGRLLGIADFLKALVSAQQKKDLGETNILHKFIYGSDAVKISDEISTTTKIPPWICGGTAAIFTRSSAAYKQDGSMVTVDNPRFETGAFGQGIMMEEGTTNLLTANQASVETNLTGLIPTGGATNTRDTTEKWVGAASVKTVTNGAGTAEGLVVDFAGVTASNTYTASVYLKGSGIVNLKIRESNSDGGTIGDTNSADITLTGTWMRYSITRAFGPTGVKAQIHVRTTITQAITFYTDGIQLEQKSYATSWQLPGTARAAETMTVPTAGIFAKGNWTVEGTYIPKIPTNVGSVDKSLFYCSIDANNYYKFVIGWGSEWHLNVTSNGVSKIISGGATVMGTPYSWMIAGNGSVIRLCVNGAQIGSDLAYTEPVGALPANAYIGSNSGGLYQANGILDNVRISSRARTLAEHQTWWNGGSPAAFTADADTTLLVPFDGSLQDSLIASIPVCGFVEVAS